MPSAKIERAHLPQYHRKHNITIFGRFDTNEEGEVLDEAGARVHPEFQNPPGRIQEDER